jgi:hypothetical protein
MGISDQFKDKAQKLADQAKNAKSDKGGKDDTPGRGSDADERAKSRGQGMGDRGKNKAQGVRDEMDDRFDS